MAQHNPYLEQRSPHPYGPQQRRPAPSLMPWAVIGIIIACIVMFVVELSAFDAVEPLAMYPGYPMPWMFVTSIFMHASFDHLFWNMFMFFMFGIILERMIGTRNFIILFLLAGVVGNVGYMLFSLAIGSDTPAVGASGAIYGVFACLTLLAPHLKVYIYFVVPVPIWAALAVFAAIDLLFMGMDDNIAHAAHLAGLAVGLAFAYYIKKKLREHQERQAYSFTYEVDSQL